MPNRPQLRYWQDATGNRYAVDECGVFVCIYCRLVGPASDIRDYAIELDGRETVICPRCGIDAVVARDTLPSNEEDMMRIVEQDRISGFGEGYRQDGDDTEQDNQEADDVPSSEEDACDHFGGPG